MDQTVLDWLQTNFYKTELEFGRCLRLPQEGPCDIYLTCPKFVTTPQYIFRLQERLRTEEQLIADANERGWAREVERQRCTADRIRGLLDEIAPHCTSQLMNGDRQLHTNSDDPRRDSMRCQRQIRVPDHAVIHASRRPFVTWAVSPSPSRSIAALAPSSATSPDACPVHQIDLCRRDPSARPDPRPKSHLPLPAEASSGSAGVAARVCPQPNVGTPSHASPHGFGRWNCWVSSLTLPDRYVRLCRPWVPDTDDGGITWVVAAPRSAICRS
ncbi:hypothetical protein ABZ783_13340 [Micromonospora sp. NPDC047738]|uniref:hypothetical protein n=1 Tax=Micromonospora sp. NPDC047738 TaxID=3155741 RepID=UPI0033C9C857